MLLDNVRKNEAVYLGYAVSRTQLDALAKVTRPIQAWYTTETVDLIGRRQLDSGRPPESGGVTMASELAMPGSRAFGAPTTMSNAYNTRSTGNRIDGGIHSGFNHIMIVVDTTKVATDLYPEIQSYDFRPEGTYYQAAFGHLMHYNAGYYGYMWSLVYACDMFQRFKELGMLNPEAGKYYRDKIISKGGTKDGMDLVRDYLGREPNLEAFAKELGLKK